MRIVHRFAPWLLMVVCFAMPFRLHAEERPRAMPYTLWLEGTDRIHRSGTLGESLTWVVVEDGEIVLGRNASNELSYTYYANQTGREYFVYLEQWGGKHYVRVSNIVAYRPGSDSEAPVITSERAAVAIRGRSFRYVVEATGERLGFRAANLPDGLTMDGQGVISGVPAQIGNHAVTLSASSGENVGTAAFALSIVDGVNDGGLTSRHTLVLDSGYNVTWNLRPEDADLTMVVKENGVQVLGRNVLGVTRDGYYANKSGRVYSIHLESVAGSSYQRVSNIVYYQPGTNAGLPLITSSPSAFGTVGQANFVYQINALNAPTSFSATGLPGGLSVTSRGLISGTPGESGTFLIGLAATNPVGTARSTLTLVVSPAANDERLFTLFRSADHIVYRSPGRAPSLTWVVRAGGREVLRRHANDEESLPYHRAAFEPAYSVHLEAWINGAYRRVSNTVGEDLPALAFVGETSLLLRAGSAMEPFRVRLNAGYQTLQVFGLPAGLSLSDATISGTPTTPGSYPVQLQAHSTSGFATATLAMEVLPAVAETAPEKLVSLRIVGEHHTLHRTAADLDNLAWVVTMNGEVVLQRSAGGETSYTYHRNFLPGEYTVHLEAPIQGKPTRVSNVVGYTTPNDDGTPVFATSRHLVMQAGRHAEVSLLASDEPSVYAASSLPPGLYLSSAGVLSGTPATPGRHPVRFFATSGARTGSSAFTLEITPVPTGAVAGTYRLVLADEHLVVRSPGQSPNLSWVIRRDGVERLSRLAHGELAYRYHRNFEPGTYTVHLEAYLGGTYQIVSNQVSYTVGAQESSSLLAHALGAVNGKSATYLQPAVSASTMPDGRPALALRYTVDRSDAGVVATLEGSTNLQDWSEVTPLRQLAGGDESFELREDRVPLEAGGPSFFRVKIDRAQP